MRGATSTGRRPSYPRGDFNPRTPCGVRPRRALISSSLIVISIHAPRAGCDAITAIHRRSSRKFQSTHPVRGATIYTHIADADKAFQSTHPVRGATRRHPPYAVAFVFQSTHPVRGATRPCSRRSLTDGDFNPRTPCGVRRSVRAAVHPWRGISIHAPRAGCDRGARTGRAYPQISIHAPRAGCDAGGCSRQHIVDRFQSTHPVRGATANLTILTR